MRLFQSKKFPVYIQADSNDCGPACLKIISKYYGKDVSIQYIRDKAGKVKLGTNLLGLSQTAESLGFNSRGVRLDLSSLESISLPAILFLPRGHFVVLYKVLNSKYFISDPAKGLIVYKEEDFTEIWTFTAQDLKISTGIALILEITSDFNYDNETFQDKNIGFKIILNYISKFKSYFWQLAFGLIITSIIQFFIPIFTQSIVDVGIKTKDINFVYVMLLAQFSFFVGMTVVGIFRTWILLHLGTKLNIVMISDFIKKLMKLPISFFDTQLTGDLMQRINDHHRIQSLITDYSLEIIVSILTMIVYCLLLAYYDFGIFLVFFCGTLVYFLWMIFFLPLRRKIDQKRFDQSSIEQSNLIEVINGMQDIKLQNAEIPMRWRWEDIQIKLYGISVKNLKIDLWQGTGANFLNEVKNLVITAYSAVLVINGDLTLGMMLAIAYIVGYLNSPVAQLLGFFRQLQDAKLSMERLSEIHVLNDENQNVKSFDFFDDNEDFTIRLKEVSFKYPSSDKYTLKNCSLIIPENKITAIVGASGSGKSTLLKLLLKFYEPTVGSINVGQYDMSTITPSHWRDLYGVVMQDGFIFKDSLVNNIIIGTRSLDLSRLKKVLKTCNLDDLILQLPKGYNTDIGENGYGLSSGEKQRVLIARAIYKNPNILFFDEATSALDSITERKIMMNINSDFVCKTKIIIAHRLSTIRYADQIIVLDKGEIVEIGNHEGLINNKGFYFNLVTKQL